MAEISPLSRVRQIIDDNGAMTEETRVYFDELENRIPITGNGAPEDAVLANAGATYYDLDGTTGSIIYVKLLDEVSGDGTKGWTLA